MNVKCNLCFLFVALLASCDKANDSAKSESANDSKSKITRAGRSSRKDAPSSLQALRASLNAAMKIEAPEARDQALAEVARSALKLAPEYSAEAIKKLSADSAEKLALFRYCATLLVEQDPEDALAWAASLGSGKDIAAAKAEIALALVASDPERAVKLISPSDITETESNGAATQVLKRWTANAPLDATAWVIKFPPGESRETAMKIVTSQWLFADARAACSWIDELNNPSVRKEATRAMVDALVQQPPPIRELLLGPVDSGFRSELEQQVDEITQEQEKATSPPPSE